MTGVVTGHPAPGVMVTTLTGMVGTGVSVQPQCVVTTVVVFVTYPVGQGSTHVWVSVMVTGSQSAHVAGTDAEVVGFTGFDVVIVDAVQSSQVGSTVVELAVLLVSGQSSQVDSAAAAVVVKYLRGVLELDVESTQSSHVALSVDTGDAVVLPPIGPMSKLVVVFIVVTVVLGKKVQDADVVEVVWLIGPTLLLVATVVVTALLVVRT